MTSKDYLQAILTGAIVAIIVVVVLKIVGYDSPAVIGGAVAGGIVGALVARPKKSAGKGDKNQD